MRSENAGGSYSDVERTAQEYYDSEDADTFYRTVWGGEDIHVGIYRDEAEDIFAASRRTVATMADRLFGLVTPRTRIVDIGSGYGGSARYLADRFDCQVDCVNISPVQNRYAREKNEAWGLAEKVTVVDGSFEDLPYDADTFDVAWAQDCILHSGNREKVVEEVARVMKPGGVFIFTDPMQAPEAPPDALQPVLDRIHLDTMGSFAFYREAGAEVGLEETLAADYTPHMVTHYSRVRDVLESRLDEIGDVVSDGYIENMMRGLGHWVDAGSKGLLNWGILEYRLAK